MPGRNQSRVTAHGPQLVLGAGLAIWTALAVQHARRLWFFGDDFDFLLNRHLSFGGDHGLLVPHNEHWSTVPIILFRLNFAIFGLHHYLPYALLPIVCHVLVCVFVFVLLRLAGVGPWVASLTAIVGAFAAGGAGVENTLWDFQVGFLGSALLGLASLTVLTTERWGAGGRVVAVALLVLSLMSSGMGIVMVIWVATFLLAREGLRSAVLTIALPALVYLAWFAAYGHGHSGAPPPQLSVAPIAAMRGIGGIWSAASGVPSAGPVILLVLVTAVVLGRHVDRLFALAGSGLVTLVVAYLLLGYSRSGLGIDAAVRSRYMYFGVLLSLPALSCALGLAARALHERPQRIAGVVWIMTAVVVVGVGAAQEARWTRERRGLVGDNQHQVAAAGALVASGAPLLRSMPMPEHNPDVNAGALARGSVQRALPNVRPGRLPKLDAAAHLQVDVGSAARSFAPPTTVLWRGFEQQKRSSDQLIAGTCSTRRAGAHGVLEIPLSGAAMEVEVTVSGTGVTTRLESKDLRSHAVRWQTQTGVPVNVASTAGDATLRIGVPAGDVTVCEH